MGENGLSASDVALLSGNNDGFGGGSSWGGLIWLFAIIAMFNGGFGGGFGGRGAASQDFIQNGFNFNDLQDQNRDIMNAITNGTAQAVAAANQAKYDEILVAKDIQNAIGAQLGDIRSNQMQLMANQNDCCCSTKQALSEGFANVTAGIAQARYENAMNTAAINANTSAGVQKIIDTLTGNQIQDLRDQVQALQLQSQLAGVVRYPQGWTYNAGNNPFCNNNCGMNM